MKITHGRVVGTAKDGSPKLLEPGTSIGRLWFRYLVAVPNGATVPAGRRDEDGTLLPMPEGRRLVHATIQVGPDEQPVGNLHGVADCSPKDQFERATGRIISLRKAAETIQVLAEEAAGGHAIKELAKIVWNELGSFRVRDSDKFPDTKYELPANYMVGSNGEILVPIGDGKYQRIPGHLDGMEKKIRYGARRVTREELVKTRAVIRFVVAEAFRRYHARRDPFYTVNR